MIQTHLRRPAVVKDKLVDLERIAYVFGVLVHRSFWASITKSVQLRLCADISLRTWVHELQCLRKAVDCRSAIAAAESAQHFQQAVVNPGVLASKSAIFFAT
jgi:hypothetical protein